MEFWKKEGVPPRFLSIFWLDIFGKIFMFRRLDHIEGH